MGQVGESIVRDSVDVAAYAASRTGTNSVEHAASVIRQAILTGQFGPGQRIKVADVAERFDLGSMPIREALRKLEGEGLVEIEPNRGATVIKIDRKFVTDLYEVRSELQLLAVRRCIRTLTLAKLEHLEALIGSLESAIAEDERDQIFVQTRRFHLAIMEFGGNAEAMRIFQRGWDLIDGLRRWVGYRSGRLPMVIKESRILIDAMRRQDVAAAEAIIRLHHNAGLEDLLSGLDESHAPVPGYWAAQETGT